MLAEELLRDFSERKGAALRPVLLVVGEERYFADEVVAQARKFATEGGIDGLNCDTFTAGESNVEDVMAAVKSAPMMAPWRFVWVRGLDRWETKEDRPSAKSKGAGPLDQLALYAASPNPRTILVMTATKLHAGRKIVTHAKKVGAWISCDPLKKRDLGPWIVRRAEARGHRMSRGVSGHLADLVAGDLYGVEDVVERLSLFVGPGAPITEDAVAEVAYPVRPAMMWDLTDALSAERLDRAFSALAALELARGMELPTLGAIASTVRKLAKFKDQIDRGETPAKALAVAQLPPFKADETLAICRKLSTRKLRDWLVLLAETDLALKGGAKRPSRAVLESTILSMCR